ncbi:MAG TPA: hypothetical protein VFY83_01255 [Anaerolineales bacterium]|nr:hypothetical protein [Anaerolineales bacterium]
MNKLTIDMRREASTIETGSSAIKSVGLVNKALAMEICKGVAPADIYVDDVLVKCHKYSGNKAI